MILSLSIRDFVLIDRLDIEPGQGFTALTGETGAGKSIILDALSLALGHAADRAMIRAGQEQASVAVEFSPPVHHPVWAALTEAGVEAAQDETLTLKRLIRANGPARAFVNDQTTSHWPIRFDADAPRATPLRSASELSPIRRWLIGYRDDDEL